MPSTARRRGVRTLQLSVAHIRRALPHAGLILLTLSMKWAESTTGEPRIGLGLGIPVVLSQILWGTSAAGGAAALLALVGLIQWKGTAFAFFTPLYLGMVWVLSALVRREYQNELIRFRLVQEEEDVRVSTILQSLDTERRRISGSRQRIEKVLMLTKVASDLSSTLDLSQVVEHTLMRTKELTGEQGRPRLILFDEQGARAYLPTDRGLAVAREEPDPLSRWVRQHSLPLHITDSAHDPRFRGARMPEGARSGIASPLMQSGSVMGVLQVHSPSPEVFTQEDWRLLGLLADLSSVALQNALLYQRTQEEAITDGLTGVFVHRYFRERLTEEVGRSRESAIPLILIMLDIDDFKSLNDSYGHLAGDAVLRALVGVLREGVRVTDMVARYGGEEFAVLLLETPLEGGKQVAERLRQAVESHVFAELDETRRVTVSMGVACFPDDAGDERQLIERADENLYAAKRGGKNRVVAS